MSDLLRKKVEEDPDFIAAPRYGDSLKRAATERERAELDSDGQVPRVVARMLRMTQEEATETRERALAKVRGELGDS